MCGPGTIHIFDEQHLLQEMVFHPQETVCCLMPGMKNIELFKVADLSEFQALFKQVPC
jgi:hypothetical protein